MHKALFWSKASDNKVKCSLCRFRCLIAEGKRGICGVRLNQGGELYTLVYGKIIAENIDHIEKKPLFHFCPASLSYSVSTVGCNFRCLHCQNYEISQWTHERDSIPGTDLPPEEVVSRTKSSGCRSIAYTYTEPTIFYEYAYDIARLAKAEGLANVFVTNGYTTPEALEHIAPYLDAANVDLKGFTEKFYKEVVGSTLFGVLDTLKLYKKLGIWLEVTTLVIPGHNDTEEELREIARFMVNELGADTPWHVTAFYPTYKMKDRPPTPVETLRKARRIGLEEGLSFVYEGNVPGEGGENTFCPKCGKKVISRCGFKVSDVHIANGACSFCKEPIPGIWR